MTPLLRSSPAHWAVGLLFCATFAGCGGDGLTDVSGVVTVDQTPLAQGEIIFEASDQSSAAQGSPITDGKYSLRMAPGKKIVRINASEGNGKIDPVMKAEVKESIIPPEFNSQSTLTADIQPGKNESVDFDVKRIAKKR